MKGCQEPSPQGALVFAVDRIEILELLEQLMSDAGLCLRTFTDPHVALGELASAKPRPLVLLTGCLDSEGSGLELMRQCKELEPELKLVLWSGMPEGLLADLLTQARVVPDARFCKGAGTDCLRLRQKLVALAGLEPNGGTVERAPGLRDA